MSPPRLGRRGLKLPRLGSTGQRLDGRLAGEAEPALRAMAPMLRRRAGVLDRMALEVAYRCLDDRREVPAIFCSRHGEASRSVDLMSDLAQELPLSPTMFGLSVHNATGGLFSIGRGDHAGSSALAAGSSSVEHAAIEACGLLADGASEVLLVVYDRPLPALYAAYQDCHEQPFAWAWLMQPPAGDVVSLSWSKAEGRETMSAERFSPGLEILRFYLRRDRSLDRICQRRRWCWSWDA